MIRTFIAVDLAAELRRQLETVQDQLRREPLEARVSWTRPANLHLSLQFIGLVGEEMIPPITTALAGVAAGRAAFKVPVVGLGAFPHPRKARVLWAGCADDDRRVGDLAVAIGQALQPLGFPPEPRPYTAHITLARIRRPRPDTALTAALDCLTNKAFGTLGINTIHLFQSQLQPTGAIYTKLSSHELTAADGSG